MKTQKEMNRGEMQERKKEKEKQLKSQNVKICNYGGFCGFGLLVDVLICYIPGHIYYNKEKVDSYHNVRRSFSLKDHHMEGLPTFIQISENDFSFRKPGKQKEEDIVICECKYDPSNPESACGERCLNVLTSTECTPEFCPCGINCKNQRFQKREYAKTELFRTEGRGWGLQAYENIKAGQFIIEYCGEVIPSREARRRSHSYETLGLKDAYIITLSGHESIDATRKGSIARFINHSCQSNCETRKWNVMGEVRVGIFTKQDISVGTELTYDYNFEWYGGAKVRCLCGAASCFGFLGAKSRGFQEDTYLWEDDDDRYSVENIPLYDSEEDEPSSKLLKMMESFQSEITIQGTTQYSTLMDVTVSSDHQLESHDFLVKPFESDKFMNAIKIGDTKEILFSHDTQQPFTQSNAMISRVRSNSAGQNYQIGPRSSSKKRSPHSLNGRSKSFTLKKIDVKRVAQMLASEEEKDEILKHEEMKNYATTQLNSLYNEIRPAIEERERETQDSVPTNVAEKWIESSCFKLKAEFDLHFSIIKNLAFNRQKSSIEAGNENDVKLVTL